MILLKDFLNNSLTKINEEMNLNDNINFEYQLLYINYLVK